METVRRNTHTSLYLLYFNIEVDGSRVYSKSIKEALFNEQTRNPSENTLVDK